MIMVSVRLMFRIKFSVRSGVRVSLMLSVLESLGIMAGKQKVNSKL